MVKRSSKKKKNTEAPDLSAEQIKAFMREMGRKGGKKGGKARLKTMTPEERSERARAAAQARWKKKSEVGE